MQEKLKQATDDIEQSNALIEDLRTQLNRGRARLSVRLSVCLSLTMDVFHSLSIVHVSVCPLPMSLRSPVGLSVSCTGYYVQHV